MNFLKRKAIFRALRTDQHSAFPHLSAADGEMSRPQEGTRVAVRTEVFSGHMSISQKVQFSWMPSWQRGGGSGSQLMPCSLDVHKDSTQLCEALPPK